MEAFSGIPMKTFTLFSSPSLFPWRCGRAPRRQIHRIGTKDFFDRESTARLCRMTGAKLPRRISTGFSAYQGWVWPSPPCVPYRETGALPGPRIWTASLKRLYGTGRPASTGNFSWQFPCSSFTPGGGHRRGWDVLPDDIVRMLRSGFFVAYISDKGPIQSTGYWATSSASGCGPSGEQAAAMIHWGRGGLRRRVGLHRGRQVFHQGRGL